MFSGVFFHEEWCGIFQKVLIIMLFKSKLSTEAVTAQ